jgi:fructose-1,6-bisphosphatase/inositol monophosphatase family enzyme
VTASWELWRPRLEALCDRIRTGTREALLEALRADALSRVMHSARRGVGDITFGLDLPSEELIDGWLREEARHAPLSVLTEDSGWRHFGPAPDGCGSVELPGFDHGGPRIAFDPVDGTRNLMVDLRSAWTVVSFAGPGSSQPRFGDLVAGITSEIPASRARSWRRLCAQRGAGTRLEEHELESAERIDARALVADGDTRVDNGYFPFFRYEPALRPSLAALEAAFFARVEEHEGADLRCVYDDQYISNAGQLVLLALGAYRMVVDARALVARRAGRVTTTSKPYDLAGALICAQEAGARVTRADGTALEFPIDAETPLDMIGYANEGTRARLEPHWLAVLSSA